MVDITRVIKIFIVLAILFAAAFFFWGRDYSRQTQIFDESVSGILKNNGIGEKDLRYGKKEFFHEGRQRFLRMVKHYELRGNVKADDFLTALKALPKSNFKIAGTAFEKDGYSESATVSFSFKNRTLYVIKFLQGKSKPAAKEKAKAAKIAIVLDDFGYNMNNFDELLGIDAPLTVSVLPNLPYSKRIAAEAAMGGIEVMLHLPLEPHGKNANLEEGTIMVDMTQRKVNDILTAAIESVPGAKGVSNHMGSKATEDYDFMKRLFARLKEDGFYFLDNLVTDESVCGEAAKAAGIKIAARDVFLDNESDGDYIERQIIYTADLAAKTGSAIGVGHDRPSTLATLAKTVPKLKEEGFEFVRLSELVK